MRGRIFFRARANRTERALRVMPAALAMLTTIAFAVVLMSFSSCATMAGWVGIASEKSVDESVSTARRDLEAEIAGLKGDVDRVQDNVVRIERLGALFEETVQATEELKQLAGVMESRLQKMPRDTIVQLVEILQDYLERGEN